MPTLIPYAKPAGPHCLEALPRLALPNLSALLQLLGPGARHRCEEDSLTPLAEQLHAHALGLQPDDGLVPWAALDAQQLGLVASSADAGWAWLTPCHWQVNTDHVRMAPPADSHISEQESRALMEAMHPFFADDGITVHQWHRGHWLASGSVLAQLPTASLARAAGGAVDHWMPRAVQARPLRRLQNEMQMLLYSHPVNDARAAAGLLAINSFWVSGTGPVPAAYQAPPQTPLAVLNDLAEPGLRDDAAAWTQAWQTLDAGPLAELLRRARAGEPLRLTLCAENSARTFDRKPTGLWARLTQRWGRTDVAAVLQDL